MDKNIFEVITEYAVNEGLDNAIQQSEEYMQVQEEIDRRTADLDSLGLTKEQWSAVNRLVSSYNENGALYGKMAYQRGFRDCADLLMEAGVVKDGKKEGMA